MIPQFEVNRQVSKKVPGLVTFVRAEPVFNWQGRSVPGISGFDFRIFGGLRYSFNKAATNTAMDTLRKQLKESDLPPAVTPPGAAPAPVTAPSTSAQPGPSDVATSPVLPDAITAAPQAASPAVPDGLASLTASTIGQSESPEAKNALATTSLTAQPEAQ